MNIPASVQTIGANAFYNCTAMTEVKLPSNITSIGDQAFYGCSALNDVYTYTVEPQTIDQNTFSTYTTATLHCPQASYYNYYYDTQWSQFLNIVPFDEDYDYVYVYKDYNLMTDDAGTISGNPDLNIEPGGSVSVEGQTEQECNDIHVKGEDTHTASLISNADVLTEGDVTANISADNLYFDINITADRWYYFCFPYDIDLTQLEKEGSYIFRYYDGEERAANGSGGWKNVTESTLHAGQGYIFRSNTSGDLSLRIAAPDLGAKDINTTLAAHGTTSTSAEHQNWNLAGNVYMAYYDINDVDYTAPIVVWDGSTYAAYRPGDDSFTLAPFQAFFVQKPDGVDHIGFQKSGRSTYLRTQDSANSASKRARRAASLSQDRLLVDLALSDTLHSDRTRIVVNEEQKLSYERGCDASKFLSSEGVSLLYTIDSNDTRYAINERPLADGQVKLGIVINKEGQYQIDATRLDAEVELYDSEKNVTHDLASGAYIFTAKAGTNEKRFTLSIKVDDSSASIDQVNADSQAAGSKICDLLGHRIERITHRGVYIIDGKKVAVK